MSRNKGAYKMSGNIEIEAGKLIDARSKVATKADLSDSQTWEDSNGISYLTSGQQVYVESEQKTYLYISTDPDAYDDENNWKLLGEDGGNTDIETNGNFGLKVFGNTTSEIVIGTNVSIGKNVTIGNDVYVGTTLNDNIRSLKIGTGGNKILDIGTGVNIGSDVNIGFGVTIDNGLTIGSKSIKYEGSVVLDFSTVNSGGGSASISTEYITVEWDDTIIIGTGTNYVTTLGAKGIEVGTSVRIYSAVYIGTNTKIGTSGIETGDGNTKFKLDSNGLIINGQTIISDWSNLGGSGSGSSSGSTGGVELSVTTAYDGGVLSISHPSLNGIQIGDGFRIGTEGIKINTSYKEIDIMPGIKIGTVENSDTYQQNYNFQIKSYLDDAWSKVILGSGAELRPHSILGTDVQVYKASGAVEVWDKYPGGTNPPEKKASIAANVIQLGNLQITLTTESFKLKNLTNNFEIELGVGALAKTQAEYDAMDYKDNNTLYYIKDTPSANINTEALDTESETQSQDEEEYEDW